MIWVYDMYDMSRLYIIWVYDIPVLLRGGAGADATKDNNGSNHIDWLVKRRFWTFCNWSDCGHISYVSNFGDYNYKFYSNHFDCKLFVIFQICRCVFILSNCPIYWPHSVPHWSPSKFNTNYFVIIIITLIITLIMMTLIVMITLLFHGVPHWPPSIDHYMN